MNAIQRQFPVLNYDNDQHHTSESLFHITLLENSEESIAINLKDKKGKRYLATLGADDQEINQGSFITTICIDFETK